MSKPKMWNEFVEWLDQEVRDSTSSLYGTIESVRQAHKANDGSAYVAAIKKFGAECYIQGLVDAGWRPPSNELWDDDKVKRCIDRIAAEVISRAGQN